MKTLIVVTLIASALAVPSTAQVVARQGSAPQDQPHEFTSINAEEGKIRVFTSEISLSPENYAALFSPPESALLRVTLTVVDND